MAETAGLRERVRKGELTVEEAIHDLETRLIDAAVNADLSREATAVVLEENRTLSWLKRRQKSKGKKK